MWSTANKLSAFLKPSSQYILIFVGWQTYTMWKKTYVYLKIKVLVYVWKYDVLCVQNVETLICLSASMYKVEKKITNWSTNKGVKNLCEKNITAYNTYHWVLVKSPKKMIYNHSWFLAVCLPCFFTPFIAILPTKITIHAINLVDLNEIEKQMTKFE